MKSALVLPALWALLCAAVAASDKPPPRPSQQTVREGDDEVLYLDGLADPKRWRPAECTVSASEKLKARGRPTVHVHIPVDHHAGQKKYPIGWPRMYLNLKRPDETPWAEFERFEFMVHATMSRGKPPKRVLNLQIHCPARPHVTNRNLSEITLGKWVRVSIPMRQIANVAEVRRLGLNISESDYRHGEKLDFRLGAFRLARAAEFGLGGLEVRSRVMYADAPVLKLQLDVVGPPQKIGGGLPLTIRRGKEILHTETVAVERGFQSVRIDLTKLKLAPGTYSVIAFAGDEKRQASGRFRVVESPWQEGRK